MGYKLAGCEVLGCVEIDPRMNEVYLNNHHPKYNYLMDIRDFNAIPDAELPPELFDLDILDGSPPCTTFSVAGLREETWGKKKKFHEGQKEQTLDDLAFIFIDTAAKLRPKVVIMENVEGLLVGSAWSYVQQIYRQFKQCGYRVHHWLLKAETMGVPQTRHRSIFVAIREDIGIDPALLDMSFNYEPILYGEIKAGIGESIREDTMSYKTLCKATHEDTDLADVYRRLGERERCFTNKIVWEEKVFPTLVSKPDFYRGTDKTRPSVEDLIHVQTFPEDYDFGSKGYYSVAYICGMSVPPVMMKRVVQRLLEKGVFDYAKGRDKPL